MCTLLVATLVAGFAATPGHAATPRSFFGVNAATDGPAFTEHDVALLRGARVGRARISFEWGGVQPLRGGGFDWTYYDEAIGRSARAGVRVLATLQGSPGWVAAKSSYPPLSSRARSGFASFIRAAIKRYGSNGVFWRANPKLPQRPIVDWQVWNEPNLAFWWYENPNAKQYLALLRTASKAIRGADGHAKVVLAGLPETHGIPMATYLDQLYKASPSFKKLFDVIAIHPFARGWPGVEGALSRLRAVTDHYHDSAKPALITEIGWATAGGTDIPFTLTTPKGQATRLTSTFRHLAQTRHKWNVEGVLWYNWRDLAPFDTWILNCGLFDGQGNPKPSWTAFRSFTRATTGPS